MLFIKGHGYQVVADGENECGNAYYSQAAACGFCGNEDYPSWEDADFSSFGYFFPGAPPANADDTTTGALALLADAMIDQAPAVDDNSNIPAVFTYIGQFIDHDITANTDRNTSFSNIDIKTITPLNRADIIANIANLRTGRLDLDSLYGGAAVQGAFAKKFTISGLLRHPVFKAKLRIGKDTTIPGQVQTPPDDPARDLLRLGRILQDGTLSEDDILALPKDLREQFTDGDGKVNPRRAVIGDDRNDENLAVAQVHLAMARFHNVVIDHSNSIGGPGGDTSEEAFEFARQQVRWQYQWLILNDYLPRVCDPDVVANTIRDGAPVYSEFFKANGGDTNRLPMPLEFSVAGFRFGHTMARADYDWNRFFGRNGDILPRATFQQLFQFTGNGDMRGAPTLPSNWPADWSRMADDNPPFPDRFTRKIDTRLSPPLLNMANAPNGIHARLKHLAERNLRRGLLLNIPSAQACLDGFRNAGVDLPALSRNDLEAGPGGAVLTDTNLIDQVPLWYYVLREAEVQRDGKSLGSLGSRIVSETLIGLAVCDPASYWNTKGTGPDNRWHPQDNVRPKNEVINSFAKLLKASGVL
ncbi:peroxidase family protein [Roseibium marinum]|uniref:Heme peroxidase n=1 Tax=Roseibium marinum TaxID=281252 RepID=A0A2S3UJM8_9HYPH|nr:heme peroxidase family protein [Roseibium marinum]POF27924.1 heme peroxidase [Roseibium marinum]